MLGADGLFDIRDPLMVRVRDKTRQGLLCMVAVTTRGSQGEIEVAMRADPEKNDRSVDEERAKLAIGAGSGPS